MKIQKVQVHQKTGAFVVHVWRELNKGPVITEIGKPGPPWRFTKPGKKKRAIALAEEIAEENGIKYEFSDQRGCRTAY